MRNDKEMPWGLAYPGIPKDWPKDENGEPEKPAQVESNTGNFMIDIARSMLESYGIPAIEMDREGGVISRVVFGTTGYCMRLLVPASRVEEANALLAAPPIWDEQEIEESAENSEQE